MSGVWGGWMRRLRKGQAASPNEPESDIVEPALDDVPGPEEEVWSTSESPMLTAAPAVAELAPSDSVHDPVPEPVPERAQEPTASLPVEAAPRPTADKAAHAEPAPPPDPPAEAATPPDIRTLLREGDLAGALAAGDPAHAGFLEALAAGETLLANLGHAGPDRAGLVGPSENLAGIMLAPSPGARDLLVAFGEDGGGFAVPECLIMGLGRPAHRLFIRDSGRNLALLGVERLGESYDACLMAIMRLMRTLEVRDVYCLGGGAACYSALRYGLDLGATGVLALGGLTRVAPGMQSPGLRPARQTGRLVRVAEELGADLEVAFPRVSPRPGLVLCRADAHAMPGLSALPGVRVSDAAPEAGPDLLGWADESGQLRLMLRDLLRCKAVR